MEEFERIYPPKPFFEEKAPKSTVAATIFSLVIFVWAFFTFISDDFRFIALILLVLIIHESGHFIAMKLFGYKHLKMMFIPLLGAYVHGIKDEYSQKQRATVLLAGPVPGIILGVLLLFLGSQYESFWLFYSGMLFVLINALNLLPIDPLDGGQLLQVLFISQQDLVRLIFSLISSLGMIAIGFYFDNWILMGFGFLLGFRVRTHQRLFQMRSRLQENGIDYRKGYKDLTDKEYFHLKEVFLQHSPTVRKIQDSGAIDDKEIDDLIASNINQVLEVPAKRDITIPLRILYILLWLGGIAVTISLFWIFKEDINNFLSGIQTGG